jgi:menaquinone-9 beta-reductase
MSDRYDVVVVGGGPSGAATASWLSRWGHRVAIVDRTVRHASNDGASGSPGLVITPRGVQRLIELGVDPLERGWHRHRGLRLRCDGRSLDVVWSNAASATRASVGVRRQVLRRALLARARDDGAVLLSGHEATTPLVERGFVRGTEIRQVADAETSRLQADYVVVADGAGSRFGRQLGTLRTTTWPSLTIIRGQWSARHHDEVWVESSFGVLEPEGERLVATTEVIPLGDGHLAVEIHIPSTVRDTASLHLPSLLDHVATRLADRWGLEPHALLGRPQLQRIPVGLSIRPRSGPTFVVVGDAAATVNPFNGDGLAFGLESARRAAEALHEALRTSDPTMLANYSRSLEQSLGSYFKLGRLFLRTTRRPGVASLVGRSAMRLPATTGRALRFMTGLADVETPADPAQRAALALARSLPEA